MKRQSRDQSLPVFVFFAVLGSAYAYDITVSCTRYVDKSKAEAIVTIQGAEVHEGLCETGSLTELYFRFKSRNDHSVIKEYRTPYPLTQPCWKELVEEGVTCVSYSGETRVLTLSVSFVADINTHPNQYLTVETSCRFLHNGFRYFTDYSTCDPLPLEAAEVPDVPYVPDVPDGPDGPDGPDVAHDCTSNPCNNGHCENSYGGPVCSCTNSYYGGKNCLSDYVCLNAKPGTCAILRNRYGPPKQICAFGYVGDSCDTPCGTFSLKEGCSKLGIGIFIGCTVIGGIPTAVSICLTLRVINAKRLRDNQNLIDDNRFAASAGGRKRSRKY